MTRKDYQVIATGLLMATVSSDALVTMALYMADELERNYINFDRSKFLKACAVTV